MDKNNIIEELKRKLQMQGEKIDCYEKAFCALLKLSQDADRKVLVDIIVNTLMGNELKEQFVKDALTGAVILAMHLNRPTEN